MIRVVGDLEGDLLRDLQNLGSAAKPAARAAFQSFVDRVVPKAAALTPDDPATSGHTSTAIDLKRSVRGRVTVRRNGMVVASVMAGGAPLIDLLTHTRKNPEAAASYALVQHDDPTLKHRGGGQANYIGQPFMSEVASGSVAADLDKEIASRAR